MDVLSLIFKCSQDFLAAARFSAVSREYKYFFVAAADLDVAAMRAAASHFVGRHDFRHFCKALLRHI